MHLAVCYKKEEAQGFCASLVVLMLIHTFIVLVFVLSGLLHAAVVVYLHHQGAHTQGSKEEYQLAHIRLSVGF
jgi:hypothetical protein